MEGVLSRVGFLVLLVMLTSISAENYYVTPSNTSCPEEGVPCFTLSQYANKPSNYFASNTTLILLPGNHSLDSELSIQNVSLLSVESNTISQSDTSITCKQSARFTFESIDIVSMRGLVLFGCVNNEVTRVEEFAVEDCSWDGQGRNGTGLQLIEVSTASITRSAFSSNTGGEFHDRFFTVPAGGAIIVIKGTLGVFISDCIFQNNTVTGGDYGGGGAVFAVSTPNITIVNSTLNSNTATGDSGGGGAVYTFSSPITIVNSTLNNNTVTGDDRSQRSGGAVYADSSPIIIVNSTLNNNTVTGKAGHGAAVSADSSPITIVNSILNSNTLTVYGGYGGAVYADSSPITIVNSTLNSNTATVIGGNGAGGAVYADSSPIINIVNSTLNSNTLTGDTGADGGAVWAYSSPITIVNSTLNSNTVTGNDVGRRSGGAVYALSSPITIVNSTLNNNTVTGDDGIGGAVYAYNSTLNLGHISIATAGDYNVFSTIDGSAFHLPMAFTAFNSYSGFLDFQNNMAAAGVLYAVESNLYFSGNTTVSNNHGSLFVYSCNVTFKGHNNIVNNSYSSSSSEEGGALTAFQSEIVFMGRVNLMYNSAIQGGGIAATQSKVHVYGDITVSDNTASESGGGIYAYQSELNFKSNINISRNSAIIRGGGIHAISSTTRLTSGSKTYIDSNHAERGGGMCLETSAKIYLLKIKPECRYDDAVYCISNTSLWITLHLDSNTADYGGAVYVADDTTAATCSATPFSSKTTIYDECFLQGISQYEIIYMYLDIVFNTVNTYFIDNSATVAGDVLYGGLLDRCRVSPFAETYLKYGDPLTSTPSSLIAESYLLNITNLKVQDFNSTTMISSAPVRICFCEGNQPDCSYHPQPEEVRKGETFTVSLVAVDHINNTIANTKIHASVSLVEAKLGEGQSIQKTTRDGNCTDLKYSILSPDTSEKLHLYADGPCMNARISTVNLTVNIAPCPIGFKDNNLRCDCDPILSSDYISDCSIDSETVQRKDNVWFSYMNATHHQGYILHKHCPFDYCQPATENISVNLNVEKGSDDMCALNRSGKLCGSCDDGLSLSLGSSRCRPCSNNWLALLIVFAVAGVALVAFILKLNFTVAEGTFNGLIFYANIFAANSAIFFPHDETKILTVYISWLNLDFGIETCFYDGLDGYVKTWLQFAFPFYVISLVVAIIVISDYSTKFARLFTGKNPIATLATLILLSYTKLLRTIIASLSFTTLQYSDGSHEVVWLIDPNIPYLSGKHIPLFITALIMVILGITFTSLLFAWQWLRYLGSDKLKNSYKKFLSKNGCYTREDSETNEEIYCLDRGPLRWFISNTKVIAFMDAYHNPYNPDHRYWIGLLLLVRVVLYLISAVNVLGDPRINICSINSAIVIILTLQHIVESKLNLKSNEIQNIDRESITELKKMIKTVISRKVQKDRFKDFLDTISLLNLAGLTIATFFITNDKNSQNVVAYISTGVAFVTFLAILVYHVYQFIPIELLHKIRSKLHMLPRQRSQSPVNNIASDLIIVMTQSDGKPVSKSEINALPDIVDSISTVHGYLALTAKDDEDIGPDNMQARPRASSHPNGSSKRLKKSSRPQPHYSTRNHSSRVQSRELESPTRLVQSHSKPLNDSAHHLSMDRGESSSSLTARSPPSHLQASCNEETPGLIESELPNLATGRELLSNLLQPSVLVKTRPLEDDESSPLLPQDHA